MPKKRIAELSQERGPGKDLVEVLEESLEKKNIPIFTRGLKRRWANRINCPQEGLHWKTIKNIGEKF